MLAGVGRPASRQAANIVDRLLPRTKAEVRPDHAYCVQYSHELRACVVQAGPWYAVANQPELVEITIGEACSPCRWHLRSLQLLVRHPRFP
jgi:hypothetical protein